LLERWCTMYISFGMTDGRSLTQFETCVLEPHFCYLVDIGGLKSLWYLICSAVCFSEIRYSDIFCCPCFVVKLE
jgi:hypothetical protein